MELSNVERHDNEHVSALLGDIGEVSLGSTGTFGKFCIKISNEIATIEQSCIFDAKTKR